MTLRTLFLLLAIPLALAAGAGEIRPTMLLLDGAFAGPALVAVGERGTVLRSTDAGRHWGSIDSGATATLTGVAFADATHGWAVGHDALILATRDGGLTWQKQWQGENLQDSFLDVLAVDANHVIAVGAYGLMVSTADGGRTWSRTRVSDDDFHFNRITRGPTGTLYVAGERGTLLKKLPGSPSWQRIDAPYDGSFYGILPLEATTLVAYGLRGRIYRSDDDGGTWTLVPAETRGLIATAVRTTQGVLVFAGQARTGLVSRDGGRTVQPVPEAMTTALAELLPLPDGSVLALGEAGAGTLPPP